MHKEFELYSKFPVTNRDLLHSPYAGGKDMFLTCHSKIATATRELPQRLIYVRVAGDVAPMVVEPELRDSIKVATGKTLTTLAEHKVNFSQNAHTPPRTLGLGGFLWVQQGGEGVMRQFVMKRTGKRDSDLWTCPSVMASNHPYLSLAHALIDESGVVAVNDADQTATVMVPYIKTPKGKYDCIAKAVSHLDVVALKRFQERQIVEALEVQGLGHYKLRFQRVPAEMMTGGVPLRDEINLSYPSGPFEHTDTLKGYGVKDTHGSFNVHMPFLMSLPENVRLIAIDCQGLGRQAALYDGRMLHALHEMGATTKVMSDFLRRAPAPVAGPVVDKPAPPPVVELRRLAAV